MGRYVSQTPEVTAYYGIRDVLPTYGTGGFRYYGVSGTFVVPPGVTQVRVTALGAGGGGGAGVSMVCSCFTGSGGGGGGGGYVVATTPVTPGCICTITIGTGGTHMGWCTFACGCCTGCDFSGGTGGITKFGAAICANGGAGGCAWGRGYPQSCFAGGGGGTSVVSSGTVVVARSGNTGCNGCCNCNGTACNGGASGSPIGGGGTGPWPGTTGADPYDCKSFAGDLLGESEIAAKFLNVVRWPGETILSTVRSGVVAGVPAGAPGSPNGSSCATSYLPGAYAGAAMWSQQCYCCVCPSYGSGCYWTGIICPQQYAAGCGGGGAGGRPYGYTQWNGYYYGCCGPQCMCGGCPGNGFLVVEY